MPDYKAAEARAKEIPEEKLTLALSVLLDAVSGDILYTDGDEPTDDLLLVAVAMSKDPISYATISSRPSAPGFLAGAVAGMKLQRMLNEKGESK